MGRGLRGTALVLLGGLLLAGAGLALALRHTAPCVPGGGADTAAVTPGRYDIGATEQRCYAPPGPLG